MKSLAKLGILAAMSGALFLSSCAGEYYVTDEPADVVYERPVAPYDGAVWIEGDWVWSGGRYVREHGHWAHPRPGRTYEKGHWEHNDRGYKWHKGRWH
ncbi:MAG TPA: hypothetical protein VHC47_00225 [Mucilaginibacter sp.]|nr:hypothetical protein [Mucilaginibacter sp.]